MHNDYISATFLSPLAVDESQGLNKCKCDSLCGDVKAKYLISRGRLLRGPLRNPQTIAYKKN